MSRKEDLAILALLTEPTLVQAAKKTGISEATLWRWQQKESFKHKYQEAKNQAVTQATARLRQGMTIAADTLIEIAQNKKAPAMARVHASKTILESGLKAQEMEDIMHRLEKLEQSEEAEEVAW
ncbi:hypothetical protein [Bacillus massilioanorexius]|uniref:hypothetical protein n=1 Tax=Bacillus massilioanorexius TaxID=1468413 RepID=UPI001CA3255E|nr:hypothetical protein [Bacillus massilioanorexius]